MDRYIGYFFSGPEQFLALASVIAVWLGFQAIGAAAGGRHAHPCWPHPAPGR